MSRAVMVACLRWAGALFCALAVRSAARADTPPVLTGTFQSHEYYGDCLGLGGFHKITTMPSFQLKFDCSAEGSSVGAISGTISIVFPATTPSTHYNTAGTHLIFDTPLVTRVVTDLLWTPRADISNNSGKLVVESYNTEGGPAAGDAQCRVDGPVLTPAGGVATSFHSDATCTWASLPTVGAPNSPNPLVYISSLSAFSAKSGNLASRFQEIVSSYSFSATTADLSVDHIEVVQTVQDEANSIPLIAEKPTVVRVFVKYEDTGPFGPTQRITALLHGFHGSTELPGSPLSPFNGTILPLMSFNRDHTDDAFNFLLPDTWLDQGHLQLVADVNPNRTAAETNYNNNSSTLTVSFGPSPIFLVNYLPVCYQDLQHCPTNSISKLDAMARKLYPVSDFGFVYAPLKTARWLWHDTLENQADSSSFKAYLRRRFALLDSSEGVAPDRLAAWLPALNNEFPLGSSDPKWLGSTGRVSYDQDNGEDAPGTPADYRDAAHSFAHEIAHNLGLRHTDKAGSGPGKCESDPGCCAVDPGTDFPFADATIHEVGFDTVNKVAVPSSKKDLMSYCSPPGSDIWISPFDYKKLIAGVLKPLARRSERSLLAPSDYVIVTGSANRDGKGGKINSIDHLTAFTGTEASDPNGSHCLQFSNSSGTVVPNHCFALTFEAENHGQAGVHLLTEAFSIKAPFPAGATKISLVAGSAQLASVTQSAHAPTISITSPSSGAVWSGTNTVTWTASDADGDPLTYSVLTSPDNGATWLPMETDLTAARFTFDTAELSAGSKTLFKVLASDGFNTTATTVGPLTIAAQPLLEATPALDFGIVASGQSSTLPILLTNRGELAVKVTALTFDNARFSADAALPFSIAPGGSASANVSFKPTSVGLKTAGLKIVSDDAARSSLIVSLSGAGCVSVGGRPCTSPRTPRVLPRRG